MNPKRSKKKKSTVRVWTYDEARKAVPYISGVMQSIRDHGVEALQPRPAGQADRQPPRPTGPARPGRPGGQGPAVAQGRPPSLRRKPVGIARHRRFLRRPIRGEAFIPFLQDEHKLAWFVFDLFDEEDRLKQWRFHDDPLEKRRPIARWGPSRNPSPTPSDQLRGRNEKENAEHNHRPVVFRVQVFALWVIRSFPRLRSQIVAI